MILTFTDAIHHRLRGASPIPENNYQCYDCGHPFPTLVGLANHSIDCRWHSQERCLLCCDQILVYIQLSPPQISRLHTCKKALLQYQNSDLQVLAADLADIFRWQKIKDLNSDCTIACDTCDLKFEESCLGLYKFLEHSNVTTHNISKKHFCRKCTMPEIVLTTSDKHLLIHYCTKESLPTLKHV